MLGVKRMPRPLSESRKPESRRKTAVLRGMRLRRIDSPPSSPDSPAARGERVGVRGIASIGELEEFDGVAGPDLVLIFCRDVRVDLVDDRPGIGPLVLDMREVGGEHDAIDADMLAFLDRHPLVLHAEIYVLTDIMAGQFLQ